MTGPGERESRVELHLNRLEEGPGETPDGIDVLLHRAVRSTLDAAADAPSGEISITFVPLDMMETLNRQYLDRSGPTDVVAFDLSADEPELLGDVYIAPEMARRAVDAGEAGDVREELVRLVVHGVLHVLGHEHPEDESRWDSRMYRLQEELVRRTLEAEAGTEAEAAGSETPKSKQQSEGRRG